MRILFIYDNHDGVGGAENYCRELQEKIKHQPGMHTFCIGFGAKEEENNQIMVLKKTTSKFAQWLRQLFPKKSVTKKIQRKIQEWKPDVIHLHNIKHDTASVLNAIKNQPVVHTMHDYSYICPVSYNLHKDLTVCETGWQPTCFFKHHVKYSFLGYCLTLVSFLINRKRIKNTVSHITAPSPFFHDYLIKNNFKNAHYIPPFITVQQPLPFKQNETIFLFAGNFGRHKGVYHLLDEFIIASVQSPSIKLLMIGAGPEWHNIQHLIHQHHLENKITLLEWQTDLSPYYERATAVICPSICCESFGLIMTETMSHSRPVIASNRSTAPWLIEHGTTGLLYSPQEKGALAKHILHLASHPEEANTLGANAYKKMQHRFDNHQTLSAFISLYQACIDQHTQLSSANPEQNYV